MAKVKDKYAIALFEISKENHSIEKDFDDAIWIRDSLKGDDIQAFLSNPSLSNSAKNELLENVFSDKINKHMMGLLLLTVRKNREKLLLPILDEFIKRVNRDFRRTKARVVSAKPLTAKQLDNISKILSKKIDMEVEIEAEIDTDLIGGFYIIADGLIYDNTIRTNLNKMNRRFRKGEIIARVVSATPISQSQIKTIKELVSRKVNQEVTISTAIDPELIGGFYVVVDGHFYDATVRTRLKGMKKDLKKGKFEW